MIRFEQVVKTYKLKTGRKVVLDHASVTFPTLSRVGILGVNGAGKSTLLRLIAGGEPVDRGRILKQGRVSFPVGFAGAFQPLHTARENIKFLAQIYAMDLDEVTDWIQDFAGVGKYFDMPLSTYSSGMFARLAFGTSFAFDFDIYLVDEAIEVGDAKFRAKCAAAFAQRLENGTLVLVSQNMATIRQYCSSGAILNNGKITVYDTLEESIDVYGHILRTAQ